MLADLKQRTFCFFVFSNGVITELKNASDEMLVKKAFKAAHVSRGNMFKRGKKPKFS